MSGYLEVKYPCKTNLGLNPFKSWKRQWCILRPSATCSGGALAVYCSEAGAAAGTVDIPSGSVVRRCKSRSRPYAFAVYPCDEPRKPRVLLATRTLHDTQAWMEKITALLNSTMIGTESLLKDSYSVTIVPTEFSRKCGLTSDCVLSLSHAGILVSPQQRPGVRVSWRAVNRVHLTTETAEKNRICVVYVNSECPQGDGELRLCSPLAAELVAALRDATQPSRARDSPGRKLSKSDSDLRMRSDSELGEVRRSSWYSGPSEVSLDDIDLVMCKERKRIPSGPLSRCSGEGDLAPARSQGDVSAICAQDASTNASCDSMSDRRSLLSVASGIYEEIPEWPEPALYCHMARGLDTVDGAPDSSDCLARRLEEPTYESVAECVYATARRPARRPPPLPPRAPFGNTKMGDSWNSRANQPPPTEKVTRHSSMGSLPRCFSVGSRPSGKRQHLVFPHRKRLKSDTRIATSPKSETSKENKDVETKKKKFDFAPTRDLFKNFKVSRKMKNLKITGALSKGEAKSCEFLDETANVKVKSSRCSKSVECLEDNTEFLDEFDNDLSIDFNDDAVADLALPQEIVELILRSRDKINEIRLIDGKECDYMPMSPVVPPPPLEHHYMIMSPKVNTA